MGWWETAENLWSRPVRLEANTQITVPHGYNSASATLYLQAVVTTKFVTIGPHTWSKGYGSDGRPIRVLNPPDEGDTAAQLTRHPWLFWRYEWTTDIAHPLEFHPGFSAWHPVGIPLANPQISWTLVGAHYYDVDRERTSCRVRQDYGDYSPGRMPTLSDYTVRVRVTDIADQFTDVAEKKMRVHFPIEEWQCHSTILHPVPNNPEYPHNYLPDWTFAGLRSTGVPTGEQRTFTVSDSRTVSHSGTVGGQIGLQLGSEEVVKVAFNTYENIQIGVSYNVTCTTAVSYTMYPGFYYYEFWAPEWEEKAGTCQIYGVDGYEGEATWTAVKHLLLPGNFLSIRTYVRAVPAEL